MAACATCDLIPVLCLPILGLLILQSIGGRRDPLEMLGLSFPLGGGIFTWMVFLASWAGMTITLASLTFVYFLGVVALVVAVLVRRRSARCVVRGSGRSPAFSESTRWRWPTMLVLGAFLGVACWLAVGRSYSTWDAAAIWAAKGYGIALEGTVFAAEEWGAHRLSYPLNIPLMIASVKLVSGDALPGSMALHPIFLVSTMAVCAAGLRRNGLGEATSMLAAVFVGTVPEVFYQGTIGYVNVALAFYVVAGALVSLDGIFSADKWHHLLGGLLLGLAAWTRVEGILYAGAVVVALTVASIAAKRRPMFVPWLLPLCLIGGSWMVFYELHGASGSWAMGAVASALESYGRGDLNLQEARMIFGYFRRHVFDLKVWGVLFAVWILLVLPHWRSFHPDRSPWSFSLTISALVVGSVTAVLFYVGSFSYPDFFGWVNGVFPRAFLPAAILLLMGSLLLGGEGAPRLSQQNGSATVNIP